MQNTSDMVYVYMARQGHRCAGPSVPTLEQSDMIYVSADVIHQRKLAPENPSGWVLGKNVYTNEEGYFPGEAGRGGAGGASGLR